MMSSNVLHYWQPIEISYPSLSDKIEHVKNRRPTPNLPNSVQKCGRLPLLDIYVYK